MSRCETDRQGANFGCLAAGEEPHFKMTGDGRRQKPRRATSLLFESPPKQEMPPSDTTLPKERDVCVSRPGRLGALPAPGFSRRCSTPCTLTSPPVNCSRHSVHRVMLRNRPADSSPYRIKIGQKVGHGLDIDLLLKALGHEGQAAAVQFFHL